MSFTGIKKKLRSRLSILILWSILLRMLVYFLLPPAKELGQYPEADRFFFSALTDHFADFFSFTTQVPPATYLINSFVLSVTGIKTALAIRAFLIFVSLMDIAAVIFLYKACKKAGAVQGISFFLLLLFSTILIPIELWREGRHYDHHTVFFTALFAWSLVCLIKNRNKIPAMFFVSVAGALLVSQSAVNSAVVPFSILIISFCIFIPQKQYSRLVQSLLITLLLPVTLLLLISRKNQSVGQESLTSNKAGPAMMMVVQRAYHYDSNAVRSLVIESGAPDWYVWTYGHATDQVDPVTLQKSKGWIYLAQAFGICFFAEDSTKAKGPWYYNFTPLLNYLRKNNLHSLADLVALDSADAIAKPYRFAGYSPELAPRWIGVYGSVSKKIFFSSLKKNPLGMVRAFAIQQGIFSIYGPLFPYNTLRSRQSLLARSGLRTFPDKIPLDPMFVILVLLFALVAWTTYATALLNLPVFLWQFFVNKRRTVSVYNNVFLLLSVPVILLALVFSCLVGGENDRYFIQLTPYIIILAACLPVWNREIK